MTRAARNPFDMSVPADALYTVTVGARPNGRPRTIIYNADYIEARAAFDRWAETRSHAVQMRRNDGTLVAAA